MPSRERSMTHRRPIRARCLPPQAASRLALAALAAGALAAAVGCNVVGVVLGKAQGQVPIEAKYTPDPLVPLVVIVENYRRDSTSTASDAERMAKMIGDRLTEQKAATVVDPDKIRTLREQSPKAYEAMGVTQVARAVGAGQVLYVDLTGVGVGVQMGSDAAKGVVSANVRFIDARTGLVTFPADLADGAPVGYETRMRRLGDGVSLDSIRTDVLATVSDRIARLFFRYKPDDLEALGSDDDLIR